MGHRILRKKLYRKNTDKGLVYQTPPLYSGEHMYFKAINKHTWYLAVCDDTQNLNETESETFFRYQIFSIPNPILFPIPIFFRYRYRYFFRYQNFSKPIPILFSIPEFFETESDTCFDTKNFRNRYRYFFRYQIFSKPIPIFFLKLIPIPSKKHGNKFKPNLKLF